MVVAYNCYSCCKAAILLNLSRNSCCVVRSPNEGILFEYILFVLAWQTAKTLTINLTGWPPNVKVLHGIIN